MNRLRQVLRSFVDGKQRKNECMLEQTNVKNGISSDSEEAEAFIVGTCDGESIISMPEEGLGQRAIPGSQG
jgi:hypothetical protein